MSDDRTVYGTMDKTTVVEAGGCITITGGNEGGGKGDGGF